MLFSIWCITAYKKPPVIHINKCCVLIRKLFIVDWNCSYRLFTLSYPNGYLRISTTSRYKSRKYVLGSTSNNIRRRTNFCKGDSNNPLYKVCPFACKRRFFSLIWIVLSDLQGRETRNPFLIPVNPIFWFRVDQDKDFKRVYIKTPCQTLSHLTWKHMVR